MEESATSTTTNALPVEQHGAVHSLDRPVRLLNRFKRHKPEASVIITLKIMVKYIEEDKTNMTKAGGIERGRGECR